MKRSALGAMTGALLSVIWMSSGVNAIPPVNTAEWVGSANGEWRDANSWENVTLNTTGDANAILGSGNGSNGMNNVDPALTAARNIVIGGGATVNYNGATNGDFRVRQGSNLIIQDGATWVQTTDASYTENIWTRFDPSNLILDGGTFRRTGETTVGDGGGILMMSSFNDDENSARLGPPKINVEIKNGGALENTGQVWFGADDEHSPDTEVKWTINDGTVNLTGGTIPLSNSTLSVTADLAFFYDYSESLARPKNEEYEINFTGPGSITVDSAGINVYRQDEFGIWDGGDAVSYEDLWNQGILKANGLSGQTGDVLTGGGMTARQPATFSTFFSVSGTPGMDNYVLNSLIEAAVAPAVPGDYNENGVVDAADYTVWRDNLGSATSLPNDDTAGVGADDYTRWKTNFGNTSGSGAGLAAGAVPEPSSLVLVGAALGLIAGGLTRRRG